MSRKALVHQTGQILGHGALLQRGEASGLQLVGKGGQIIQTVQLSPLAQGARPREDGGYGVGGGLFALEVLVVCLLYTSDAADE